MGDVVRVERSVSGRSLLDVFNFVVDVDNYSRLMPNVNSVQILQQNGVSRITRWDTEIEGAPLIWTERDSILTDQLRIDFDCIEGDFDVFRGCWEVVQKNGDMRVACEMEYSIGLAVIEDIVGPILKEKISENLEIMLNGIALGIEG